MGNNTIGRYCGRRYHWPVFASSSPITLEFHAFQLLSSQFILQYQIIGTILESFLYKYKNYNDFSNLENITFVYPFSWNHVYILTNVSHFTWNIIVPKMYILLLKFLKVPLVKSSTIIFNGPDINSNQLNINNEKIFTASSFQVLILHHRSQKEKFDISFTNNILKDKMENYYNIYIIKDRVKLNSDNLACAQLTTVLCALKLHVSGNYFVNISLLSFKYSGPNVGYCKYGGLSVYDYINKNTKEVLLLCENIFPITFNTQQKQVIVSSTKHLFLILFAYWPYTKVKLNITMQPTTCNGVHILRYDTINDGYFQKSIIYMLVDLWSYLVIDSKALPNLGD